MSSADVMNDLAQIKALFAGKAGDLQAKLDAAKAAWQADDEVKWNEAHTAAQSIIADMQGVAQTPAPAAGDAGSAAGTGTGTSDPAPAPAAPAADPSR